MSVGVVRPKMSYMRRKDLLRRLRTVEVELQKVRTREELVDLVAQSEEITHSMRMLWEEMKPSAGLPKEDGTST